MKNHNQIFFRVWTYKLIIRSKPMKIPKTRRTHTKSSDWYPKNYPNPSIFWNPKFGEITNRKKKNTPWVPTPHLQRLQQISPAPETTWAAASVTGWSSGVRRRRWDLGLPCSRSEVWTCCCVVFERGWWFLIGL